jgi:hypothetical protein
MPTVVRPPALRAVSLLVALVAISATCAGEGDEEQGYRRGELRLGVFFVTGVDTKVAVGSQQFPIGTRIDFSSDLGLKGSTTVPRVQFAYRFTKRHRLDFDWYNLDRSGTKVLERTIRFGDKEFTIGTEVSSFIDTELVKVAYTWLFHDDPKVTLGLSAGIHFTSFDVGISSTASISDLEERADFLAPLPMLGGRLVYRITPKLIVVASADWLFLNYDAYRGSLVDAGAFIEHRTFKHVGFGGGLNRLALDLEVDDDRYVGTAQHILTGWLVYAGIYF